MKSPPISNLNRTDGAAVKWVFDKVFAIVAGIAVLPLLAALMLALRLRGGGPVLFAHARIGRHGKPFSCLKLRTMVPDAQDQLRALLEIDPVARREWESSFKLYRDPRVDRFGAFLRKSSLDELPQLWNVLRGDMSIVGPRPITEAETQRYGEYMAEYLAVRPGLTGPWQVGGRSDVSYERRVRMDAEYVRNWRFRTDILIVLKTVRVVLLGRGAV